ncbi:MAG: BrnT family toxin [Anaerolineales bacterium]|nr:BrnT family toxin [Anaerolineales bacterium]
MHIDDLTWLEETIEKLAAKHNVRPSEVEQVVKNASHFRFISKGRKQKDENVYAAYGQTDSGRYLTVFFIYKPGNLALIISGRDMDKKERKRYG